MGKRKTTSSKNNDDEKVKKAKSTNSAPRRDKVLYWKLSLKDLVASSYTTSRQKKMTVDEIHQNICQKHLTYRRKPKKAVKDSIEDILINDEDFMKHETELGDLWVYKLLKVSEQGDVMRPVLSFSPQPHIIHQTRAATYRNVVSFNIDRNHVNKKVKLVNFEPIKLVTPVAMLMQEDGPNNDIFVSVDGEETVQSEMVSNFSLENFVLKTETTT